jgi:divalent metal cation (Fe/Co/Zn/Cd) transporter
MTALSHLLFFDALGAFLTVAVDVGRNFEVWQRSSIRHPFGLERSEVLAGLAMAVILLFMGMDLISHGMTHALEHEGGHEPHHAEPHERVSPGSVDFAALSAILSTLVSVVSLGNHARIGRTLQMSLPGFLPNALKNPSHLLTLGCSALLLLLPLLSIKTYAWFDGLLATSMAIAMMLLGGRICYALGRMLLMSSPFPPMQLQSLLDEVSTMAEISEVEEAKVWQVHYGLCMSNFKIRVKSMETVAKVRERITSLVKNRLGGGYGEGSKGVRWEISVQASAGR